MPQGMKQLQYEVKIIKEGQEETVLSLAIQRAPPERKGTRSRGGEMSSSPDLVSKWQTRWRQL